MKMLKKNKITKRNKMQRKMLHMSIEPTPLKNMNTALLHQTTQGYLTLCCYVEYINRDKNKKS